MQRGHFFLGRDSIIIERTAAMVDKPNIATHFISN